MFTTIRTIWCSDSVTDNCFSSFWRSFSELRVWNTCQKGITRRRWSKILFRICFFESTLHQNRQWVGKLHAYKANKKKPAEKYWISFLQWEAHKTHTHKKYASVMATALKHITLTCWAYYVLPNSYDKNSKLTESQFQNDHYIAISCFQELT